MSLLQLKQNPYLTPAVPKLQRSGAIANPRGLLVVKARATPRRNPFRMPGGIVGRTCEGFLGAGGAYAVNAAISQFVPPVWGGKAPTATRWGVTLLSPFLTRYFPRLGPGFGGAMYYSVLQPLYAKAVTQGIMATVKEAVA